MEIKTKAAVGSKSKTVSVLDLNLSNKLPETVKTKIKNDVGDFLVESVLSTLSHAETPVAGEDWPELSKEYAAKKKREGLPAEANMELKGDLLDSLTFQTTEDGIELGFFGDQAWKADGHLKFSGKENNTPQRRFLPGEGEEFDSSIQTRAEQIIADAILDNADFTKADFEDVETKTELYDVLSEYFPEMSRTEIRSTIAGSESLMQILDEMDLIGLL